MSELPWYNEDKGIQRLREIGMLEWICHVQPTHVFPYRRGHSDSILYRKSLRDMLGMEVRVSLKSTGCCLQAGVHGGRDCHCKGFLDFVGDDGIPECQRSAFNLQKQGDCG